MNRELAENRLVSFKKRLQRNIAFEKGIKRQSNSKYEKVTLKENSE